MYCSDVVTYHLLPRLDAKYFLSIFHYYLAGRSAGMWGRRRINQTAAPRPAFRARLLLYKESLTLSYLRRVFRVHDKITFHM
jgi:hypothetical protein